MVAKDRELGGKFFGKPRLILGCSTDYDDYLQLYYCHH
jgi:hypothetical protein